MSIGEIITWRTAGDEVRRRVLSRNGVAERLRGTPDLTADIAALMDDVRRRGDAALVDALQRFDGVETDTLRVGPEEVAEAERSIGLPLSEAIDLAIERSMAFNEMIVERASWRARSPRGGIVGEVARPVASAGLFVPSGKGSFPSVLVQIGAPAVAAGVTDLCLVVPPLPGSGGRVDPATLVVASRLGINRVYRLNGPSGIAALAHGTETVPRMSKIVGPGSIPVTLAQQLAQAAGVSVVGGLGPSDSLVIADADADVRVLAADVINEAEHGPDSSAVLVSPDRALLESVAREIAVQLAGLPEPRRSYASASIWENGGLVHVEDWDTAWEVANAYAPEHVQIATADAAAQLDRVRHAGTALLGQWTSFAASNFVIGTPATLPTTGYATHVSGVTAHTYLTSIATAQLDADEFAGLADAIVAFTDHEGFPAHAASVAVRRQSGVPADGPADTRGTVLILRWREDLVAAARRLGYRVALLYLPSEAAKVDLDLVDYAEMVDEVVNIERVHGALERLAIDDLVGVLSVDEWSIVVAAYVAREFGFPSLSPDTAIHFRDKFLQKRRLLERGVPTSRVELVQDVTAPDVADRLVTFGFPVVMKPLSGAGAALTYRLDGPEDLKALQDEVATDPYRRRTFLIEEFQDGEEWHVDGYVAGGRVEFFAVGRYDAPLIHVHEGAVTASRSFDPTADAWAYELAGALTRDALAALGLTDAVFHLECFRLADGRLVFGECAARSGGGMIVETVRAKFGVDLTEAAVRIAVGEPHPIVGEADPATTGFTFLPSAPGKIVAMPALEEVEQRPGVLEARYLHGVGDTAPDMSVWTAARVGEAVVSAPDAATYQARLDELLAWFAERTVTESESIDG